MPQINNVLSGLQLYRTKYFTDLVDENMLANALLTRPHQVSTVLSYVFGRYENNSLDFLTRGLGRIQSIESDNREYQWDVMVDIEKAITIKGFDADNATYPGLGGTAIRLRLAEKWFGPGAILEFDDKRFQVRVQGTPEPVVGQDGAEFVYSVIMADGQPESYVPVDLIQAGKKVSRAGTAYEEYSEEADILNYQTPFKLRNYLTTMRLSYDITGDAYSSVMVIAFKDPNSGKSTYLWSDYQEWQALRQWYRTMDYQTLYAQYNATPQGTINVPGTNGRPVYVGAGLLQQISPANRRTYTHLTSGLVEDFLGDLSYNNLGMNERKFIAFTGEMGMRAFDDMLRNKLGALNLTLVDTKFITGSGQELTLGGQFTTYKMRNGIELTVKHMPMYDNTVYNRKLHPISGKPQESYRMTFVDFGMRDGESNIKKVVRKDREFVQWYTGGSVAPGAGHAKSIQTLRSNAKDGYSVHFLSEQGVMLCDPTTSGELILDIE